MFKDFEYEIMVDPKVKPVVHAPRRVPIALQPKLEAALDEMEKKGIISKAEGFTPWTNSLVIQEKSNGKLQICLDPKGLNTGIIDDPHPIPTLDDITHKLYGSTLYGKLDADSCYWNVKLTKELSMSTTFNSNTRLGKYKFGRLPFGVKTSQNTFQRKVDDTYYACRGAVGIADDILVYGTESNFDLHLHEVMEATRQAGIKLNYNKCIIKTKSCSFFGNVYTPAGVKPDPEKVETIKKMEVPINKQQLQSFLGMVTYLGQLVSDMTYNMRKLLKKNVLFQWTETREDDFQKPKGVFTSQECLAYFDQKKDIFLQVDVSIQGLGAALMQKDQQGRLKPVAYALESLTDAEKRYSNIEHKLLAVIFGCIRFHHYLYARKFECHSDHKPLEDIHQKHLSDAPTRLQRLPLKLQPYHLTIKYIPGKDVAVADALS